MTDRTAWAWGLATVTDSGTVLDAWYPQPALGDVPAAAECPEELATLVTVDAARGVRTETVLTVVDLDAEPVDTADAYLRLHLLSHRLAAPNTIDLDGIFGVLPNVVWTDHGPCAVDGFETTRARLRAATGRP